MGEQTTLKVGELARRAGVTVRTLHHYDEVGLLVPAGRTGAGHRLYGEAEVRRLQQILSLRELGLALDDIARWLMRPDASLLEALGLHLDRLAERIARLRALRTRIETVAERLRSGDAPDTDQLLETMEAMAMYEKYYTPEQLERLRLRRDELGEETIREVEREWARVFERLRDAMEAGTDPGSDELAPLGARALELVEAFTGGDPGIRTSLETMVQAEGPAPAARHGMPADPELWSYLGRVMAAARKG